MSSLVKTHIDFFDKSFSETLTASNFLSVQLSLQGVAFSVYSPETEKFIALKAYRFENLKEEVEIKQQLEQVLSNTDWLGSPFSFVKVIYHNRQSTLIPNPLFEEEKLELYLNFNYSIPENQRINFNKLKSAQATNIFSIPDELAEKIKTSWPDSTIFHSSSVLIESLGINFKNKTDNNTLFVNLHEDSFDVVYFKDNKLHFFSSFRFKAAEDFIYFLLSSLEQLNLNPEDTNIILMGEIDKSTLNYQMIHRYIRHSEFIDRNDTFRYSHVLDEVMPHKYYELFNVLQCES